MPAPGILHTRKISHSNCPLNTDGIHRSKFSTPPIAARIPTQPHTGKRVSIEMRVCQTAAKSGKEHLASVRLQQVLRTHQVKTRTPLSRVRAFSATQKEKDWW